MINGNEMIAEDYDRLSDYLLTCMGHEKADEVTIKSLIGSCAEFDGAGISKSSMVFPNPVNPKESVSLKFSNVKFSLRLAFDIILLNPVKPPSDKNEMLMFMIRVLKLAFGEMVKILDEDMANVLQAIYMLSYDNHGATMEKIIEYCRKYNMQAESMERVIYNLENIKCIELVEGEYKLAETVILNLKNVDIKRGI